MADYADADQGGDEDDEESRHRGALADADHAPQRLAVLHGEIKGRHDCRERQHLQQKTAPPAVVDGPREREVEYYVENVHI